MTSKYSRNSEQVLKNYKSLLKIISGFRFERFNINKSGIVNRSPLFYIVFLLFLSKT